MSQDFYLCFCFHSIKISSQEQKILKPQSRFRIELYLNSRCVSSTDLVPKSEDKPQDFLIEKSSLWLRVQEKDIADGSTSQLQLLQSIQNSKSKLIGCYKFAMTNHTDPYLNLNRKSIHLNVQISLGLTLQYQVILERTHLGLQQLVKEHSYARKLSFIDQVDSEKQQFFPDQIQNRPSRKSFKKMKFMKESLAFQPRFWSPEKQRSKLFSSCSTSRAQIKITDNQSDDDTRNIKMRDSVHSRSAFLKFKRIGSQCSFKSQEEPLQNKSTLDELETNSISPSLQYSMQEEHIYEVIRNNSKILIPSVHEQSKERLNLKTFDFQNKNIRSGNSSSNQFKIQIILLIAVLLLSGIGINLISKSIKSHMKKSTKSKLNF